jgi:type IV secretory pathway VirJ component
MVANAQSNRARWLRIVGGGLLMLLLVGVFLLWLGGYFARDGRHFAPAIGRPAAIGALYISGDMGLRFDVGRSLTDDMTRRGIATSEISSPAFFKWHRSRAEVDAVIAQAVRDALRRTGHDRIVAIGRSYGADILQTGLADLPPALRPHIAGVILIVPGDKVFFRSDPSTIAYHGVPDSIGADTVNKIDWTPLTCIYGTAETDSLCPDVVVHDADIIGMPGGHFLDHNQDDLFAHVFAAIDRAARPSSSRRT